MSTEWNIDPQVPEPSGLYQYIQALDAWVKGAPLDDPMIGGLIQACSFGDAARRDFRSGRSSLWSLVPPIDAMQIQEASLDLPGLRALSVPLVLRGRHALHRFLPEQPGGIPEPLVDIEYLCGLLLTSLEQKGETKGAASQRRLELLLETLESRSKPLLPFEDSVEHVEIPRRRTPEERSTGSQRKLPQAKGVPRETLPEEELSTEELIQRRAQEARRSASFNRAIVGLCLMPLLAGLYFILPTPGGNLPSVNTYTSMPLVGLIRQPGETKARVHASWFALAEEERDIAVMILWDQLVDETEDPGLELLVTDHVGKTRGGVVAGKVWWRVY